MSRTEDKNKAAHISEIEIEHVMAMLLSPGSWYELFTLPWKNGNGKAHVKADGYFRDNAKLMVAEAMKLSKRGSNVYFHINPVVDELSYRAVNRVVDHADTRANEKQIARRCLLFVDADPVRASNIAATDEQHEVAIRRAYEVRCYLMEERNWPAPVMVDSGNGGYQFFRIDLPNDAASKALIERLLKSLSERFSDDVVKIDAGVFIANQMARFPGTLNRKGDDTPQRPHRVARFIDVPPQLEVVTREQLEQVAGAVDSSAKDKTNEQASLSAELQQVLKALEQRGITVKQDGDGKHILSECVFDSSHSGGTSVAIIEYPASRVKVYACKHPPCDENGKSKRQWGDVLANLGLAEKKAVVGFELTKLNDLLKKQFPPDKFLWDRRLVVGTVSIIVAKPKVGKSTLARNVALAVAQGVELLGLKVAKGEVIYLALEEREQDVQEDWRAMGVSANGDEELYVHAAPSPVEGLVRLTELVRERKPSLIVIDPLFRFTRLKDEKAYAEIYNALGPLIDLARETGTHVMLTHHSSKLPKTDPIDSPLGSTALAGVVATLISLNRSGKYRTICTVQRIGDDMPETVLLSDKATRRLTLGGTRKDFEQHDAERRILEFLEEKEPQTQAQIKEGVEGATRVVWAALTMLVKTKLVSKTGEGVKGKPFLYSLWSWAPPNIEKQETRNLF
jgi:hypothetical protein